MTGVWERWPRLSTCKRNNLDAFQALSVWVPTGGTDVKYLVSTLESLHPLLLGPWLISQMLMIFICAVFILLWSCGIHSFGIHPSTSPIAVDYQSLVFILYRRRRNISPPPNFTHCKQISIRRHSLSTGYCATQPHKHSHTHSIRAGPKPPEIPTSNAKPEHHIISA